MSRITKIARLKHAGVLRDFTWPAELPTFGRFNLIYGWNGTGKTTLSRVFRALEVRQPPPVGEAELSIDDVNVRGDDFLQSTLPIRVFNRDYIHETVFPVSGGDVPPIFVVGKESVEKQKEVNRLKAERGAKEAELNKARVAKQQAERELDRHCINRAKVIKGTLQKTGSDFNNYDKTDYRTRAKKMADGGNAASHRLSDEQRESLLAQHHATPKPKVSEVTYRIPALQDPVDQTSALLKTTVVSSAIQTLKDDPELAAWVRDGLGLHRDRGAATCLFCEQPLPADRLETLKAHFNDEYERFLRQLDNQIEQLKSEDTAAVQARFPNEAELYDDLRNDYRSAEAASRSAIEAVRTYLAVLVGNLERKRSEPFKALSLAGDAPFFDVAAIDRLNEVIRRHNQACDEFDSRVKEARNRLALDMIAQTQDEFVRLRDDADAAAAAIAPLEHEIKRASKAR